MGAMQNNNERGGSKRKKRGSVNNHNRLEAFASRSVTNEGDWGGCDPKRLQAVVIGITELGGAVTIGLSRDKGAHSLTLLLDDKRKTLWFNKDADLNEELDNVVAILSAMD